MAETVLVVDVCEKLADCLKNVHQLRHLSRIALLVEDVSKTLSRSLEHNNEIMGVVPSWPSAMEYFQREAEISVVNQIWAIVGKLDELLGFWRDGWMMSSRSHELQDQ